MKTKETSMLYTTMSNNIGQVKKQDAQKEIERLNKQENTNSWRMDESDFMYVVDESDDRMDNPCKREEGYVWIVKTHKQLSTREQALAWWNSLELRDQSMALLRQKNKDDSFIGRPISSLTGREIEEIWRKEIHQSNLEDWEKTQEEINKPNQKQFKQFDAELFAKYLSKFSLSDRYNAIAAGLLTLHLTVDELGEIVAVLKRAQERD